MILLFKFITLFSVAFVAFITMYLKMHKFANYVEEKLPKPFKDKWIKILYQWWEGVNKSSYPTLAKNEAIFVIKWIDNFKKKPDWFWRVFLGSSILTTLSFIIGETVNIGFNMSISLIQIDFVSVFSHIVLFLIVILLIIRLLKSNNITNNSVVRLTFQTFMFIASFNAIMYIYVVYLENLPMNIPILSAFLVLLIWVVYELYFRNNKIKIKHIFLTIFLTILAFVPSGEILLGLLSISAYKLYGLVFLNFIFDFTTIVVTIKFLEKISSATFYNSFLWVIADLALAFLLAYILHGFFTITTMVYLGNPLSVFMIREAFNPSTFITLVKVMAFKKHYINSFLYSSTTLLPSLFFATIMFFSFIAKFTYYIWGRVSFFAFFKNEEEKKKTPFYVFSITLAIIFSFSAAISVFITYYKVK